MALNSYFLQGSKSEQFLVQDIINEQLRMYGVEIYYLPRKVFKTDDIVREVQSSKFDDTFLLEAYLNNYEGYSPGSDLMTKFGLRLTNEVSLTISKERYEEFIAPFLEGMSAGIAEGVITEYTFEDLITRPKEGDLIYFPLGERLFEIKRVESEQPFYQLNRNYTYELSCELYEYENELIDTTIDEVDNTVEDEGYITQLNLVGSATTASGLAILGGNGMIGSIDLTNDGYGYTSSPVVEIAPPSIGSRATAVAITTTIGEVTSLKEIRLIDPGYGYDVNDPPLIILRGGGGVGAAVTSTIVNSGISTITLSSQGAGYPVGFEPTITIGAPPVGTGISAYATPVMADGKLVRIHFNNAGAGYTVVPSVDIAGISSTGIGTFIYNEEITGSLSGTTARVRDFRKRVDINATNPPVELKVSLNSGVFSPGDIVVGSISSARYVVDSYSTDSFDDPFDSNKEFEDAADSILDFSEGNPFGDY
tara:strand:+ start:28006 stop:29442 length:1437 start_codon:yes stop_codon:yes gene_type:complete